MGSGLDIGHFHHELSYSLNALFDLWAIRSGMAQGPQIGDGPTAVRLLNFKILLTSINT
jgi:hypothetical protein